MGWQLTTCGLTETFDFYGEDCLYRDHDGWRVLADVEGKGEFRIVEAAGQCKVIVDDILQDRSRGSFEQSLLITCPVSGPFMVDVGQQDALPNGEVHLIDSFQGCGYVVAAEQIDSLDGEHRPIDRIGYPVPFFREIQGDELQIVAAATHTITIDAFDVADSDALRERDWTVQNVSKLSTLASAFPDRTPFMGEVLSHLNAASWRVVVPSGCRRLILRKRYDAFHGRQRARVFMNERPAGWWYAPWQDRVCRWRWSRFCIEGPNMPEGEAVITIDPPAGAPLWSVSRIEVWAVLAARLQ